jgi:uncharacterized membrane protein
MVGGTMGQIVSLYQTGVIKDLPDIPLPFFNSAKVDAADYAYSRLSTPDGLMMVANYAITAWLAGAGGKDRAKTNPLLPIAMGVKTLVDTGVALKLAAEEWRDNKALCEYCQVATLCSIASVALAIPEMTHAFQTMTGSKA